MDALKLTFFLALLWQASDAVVCNAGTYYQSEDGGSCPPCPDETFMPWNNHTEKKCIDCTKIENSTLEILITPCDRFHDANIQYVNDHFRHMAKDSKDIPYCKKCRKTCPVNYTQVYECQNFTDIGCCLGENSDYREGEHGIRVCIERPWMCKKGQYLDTEKNDCKPCPDGTFMDEDYHSYNRCWDCQYKSEADLPLHTVITQPCTSTQPSRFGCIEGYYVNHSMSYREDDIGCSPCQTCDEGKYVGRECDMYHDTVCCDKPDMTVEDGPQGGQCVDGDRKDVGGEAGDSTSVRWVIPLLVLILLIVGSICVNCKKRLRRLIGVLGQILQGKKIATDGDVNLTDLLIDATPQSENQELEADKTKLTEEIKEKDNKLESVGIENATLQSKNQELEADKTKLTEEIKEKDNKLESVGSKNATLQSKNQELEADKTKLTDEIKEKDNKLKSVGSENAMLQSKIQELETDKKNLTGEVETVASEKETLQTKIGDLEAYITRLTNEINKSNWEIKTVGSEKDEMTKERDELRDQIEELIAAHQKEKPNDTPEHSVGQNQTVPNIITPRTSEQQNETSQRTQENAVVRELRMCLKSLKRNEVEAQASTAKRLGEMAGDERVRQTILKFSDLMQELEGLQKSERSRVRNNVTQALQVIKGTTSTTVEDGHLPAQTDFVPNTNAVTAVQGNKPATDEDGRLPASFDSVSNTDDDITVHGATPTTSGKNCLTAALDIELNSSTDISVHEATPVTDDTRLPASSVNE